MIKFTFEMLVDVTEQTTVEADSLEDAEKILLSGNCEWEEVKSQGGDWELINKEIL